MKHVLGLFISILVFNQCISQPDKLIRVKLIDNIEDTPIYPRLTENFNGEVKFKKEFNYIDEMEMNWITYLSDGLKVGGLLVKPKKPGNYPCIIYNRGGNRKLGQLVVATAALTLGELAKEGYIVIASNYRGNGNSEGKEQFGGDDVNDVVNLIDVLKEVEGADIERIGMYGWSRGGMMTYLALTRTDQIDVACVGVANSDLTQIDRVEMETNVYEELIPNYNENKEMELKKRSAIYWVENFLEMYQYYYFMEILIGE